MRYVIYAFVFGRTPELSRAELFHLLEVWGFAYTKTASDEGFELLNFTADPSPVFERLGGTVKVVRIQDEPDLAGLPEGKVSFGVSFYGGGSAWARRNLEIGFKQDLRDLGRNARFVHGEGLALSSGTVTREQLQEKGFEWSRFHVNGRAYEGVTVWVQPIDAWAARDQKRPYRDARVGMLPPKLARIIVNLAATSKPGEASGPVYDPFCGTGTVLQETLLSGYEAAGADSEPRMVDYTTKNILWLQNASENLPKLTEVAVRDAREAPGYPLEAVASEGYLGPARETLPTREELKRLDAELRELHEGVFEAFQSVLEPGKRLVVCFPYFETGRLPFVDSKAPAGYNLVGSYDYRRDEQIVGRQITIYERA